MGENFGGGGSATNSAVHPWATYVPTCFFTADLFYTDFVSRIANGFALFRMENLLSWINCNKTKT